MPTLVDKIVELHRSLEGGGVPHAFGGALALAWCTERARGTIDIDVNALVGADRLDSVLAALPSGVRWDDADVDRLRRDGQARLWWDQTPVDLFLDTTAFHETLGDRVRVQAVGPPALTAEITPDALADLDLRVGEACWFAAKATEVVAYPR